MDLFCSEYAFQYHNFTNLNFVTSHFSYLLFRLHELIISSGKIMGADLLRLATSLAKGFSQVYILMTLIPEMISFITLMRSSVRPAILDLKKILIHSPLKLTQFQCSFYDHFFSKIKFVCSLIFLVKIFCCTMSSQ